MTYVGVMPHQLMRQASAAQIPDLHGATLVARDEFTLVRMYYTVIDW
jgi:hypothetical protein